MMINISTTTLTGKHKIIEGVKTKHVVDRSPSVQHHSRSSSDCTSLYSHEDVNLIEKLSQHGDTVLHDHLCLHDHMAELTVHDNPFNPLHSHHTSHGDILQSNDTTLSVCTSVPHLER